MIHTIDTVKLFWAANVMQLVVVLIFAYLYFAYKKEYLKYITIGFLIEVIGRSLYMLQSGAWMGMTAHLIMLLGLLIAMNALLSLFDSQNRMKTNVIYLTSITLLFLIFIQNENARLVIYSMFEMMLCIVMFIRLGEQYRKTEIKAIKVIIASYVMLAMSSLLRMLPLVISDETLLSIGSNFIVYLYLFVIQVHQLMAVIGISQSVIAMNEMESEELAEKLNVTIQSGDVCTWSVDNKQGRWSLWLSGNASEFIDLEPNSEGKFDIYATIRTLEQSVGKEAFAAYVKAVKDGKESNLEYVDLKNASGNHIRVTIKVNTPTLDSDGDLMHLAGVAINVTKQYEYQQMITARDENLENIFHYSNNASLIVDLKTGTILDITPSCMNLFGSQKKSDFVGTKWGSHATEYQPNGMLSSEYIRQMHQVVLEEDYTCSEFKYLKQDGDSFLAKLEATKTSYNGKPAMVVSVEDITRAKQLQKQSTHSQKDLVNIFRASTAALMVIDAETLAVLDANPVCAKLYSSSKRLDFIGKSMAYYSPAHQPDGRASYEVMKEAIQTALKQKYMHLEYTHLKQDGTLFLADIGLSAMIYKGRDTVIASVKDITSQREQQRTIEESERRLEQATKSAKIVTWEMDLSKKECYFSQACVGKYGKSTVLENVEEYFLLVIHPNQRKEWKKRFVDYIQGKTDDFSGEYLVQNMEGAYVWVFVTGDVTELDKKGHIRLMSGIIMDVDDQKKKVLELEEYKKEANKDELTGLYNGKYLESYLSAMVKQEDVNLFIAHINLTGFRKINEAYGFKFGDEVLKKIAQYFKKIAPESMAKVFRVAGDEFIFVSTHKLPYLNISQSQNATSLKNNKISNFKVKVDGKYFEISTAVGIVLYPYHTNDFDNLLHVAEASMLRAKKSKVDKLVIYNKEVFEKMEFEQSIVTDANNADIEKEFEMVYQPIVNMRNLQDFQAEALIRWNHPKRGFLTPGHFIDVIENSGLMIGIYTIMFDKVLKQINRWYEETGKWMTVSYNASPSVVGHKDFSSNIISMMKKERIAPKRIKVEVTEGMLDNGSPMVQSNLSELRRFGVEIAIDDFGVAYSSLSRISDFEFNVLKVDKKFVDAIDRGETKVVLKMIKEITAIKECECVVEGVETKEQLQQLNALGFYKMQGYFFYKPMKAEEILQML